MGRNRLRTHRRRVAGVALLLAFLYSAALQAQSFDGHWKVVTANEAPNLGAVSGTEPAAYAGRTLRVTADGVEFSRVRTDRSTYASGHFSLRPPPSCANADAQASPPCALRSRFVDEIRRCADGNVGDSVAHLYVAPGTGEGANLKNLMLVASDRLYATTADGIALCFGRR
jgi:hypothetical protein